MRATRGALTFFGSLGKGDFVLSPQNASVVLSWYEEVSNATTFMRLWWSKGASIITVLRDLFVNPFTEKKTDADFERSLPANSTLIRKYFCPYMPSGSFDHEPAPHSHNTTYRFMLEFPQNVSKGFVNFTETVVEENCDPRSFSIQLGHILLGAGLLVVGLAAILVFHCVKKRCFSDVKKTSLEDVLLELLDFKEGDNSDDSSFSGLFYNEDENDSPSSVRLLTR